MLRPLYDPSIPLESFLGAILAPYFRNALKSATEAIWAGAQSCRSTCASGYCRPVVDPSGSSVSFTCEKPGPVPGPEVYDADLATTREPMALLGGGASPLPSLPLLQVRGAGVRAAPVRLDDRSSCIRVARLPLLLSAVQLGYNSMLGLPASEQQGTYMRHESEWVQVQACVELWLEGLGSEYSLPSDVCPVCVVSLHPARRRAEPL